MSSLSLRVERRRRRDQDPTKTGGWCGISPEPTAAAAQAIKAPEATTVRELRSTGTDRRGPLSESWCKEGS